MLSNIKRIMLFSKFPEICLYNGFYLRQPKITDAENWLNYLKHKDVAKYVPDPCIPKNTAAAQQEIKWYIDLFEKKQGFSWAIAEKSTDNIVGTIGIERWNQYHRRCEIAYDLDPKYWGQGIMTQAMKRCLIFAFRKMKVVRIEAYTTTCNEKSMRLLEKSGFHHEATLKKHRWFKNNQIDVNLFVILSDD